MDVHKIKAPLIREELEMLRAGDEVSITGTIYVARDAAHKKLIEQISSGEQLPFNLQDNIIYYMGPSPAKPGEVIGSAGPTTSSRMDQYTPPLLAQGLRGMIGKGQRSKRVREAMIKHQAIYFVAIGGAAALIASSIKAVEPVAYPELGAEAILRLQVENFMALVANDIYGNDLYELETGKYTKLL